MIIYKYKLYIDILLGVLIISVINKANIMEKPLTVPYNTENIFNSDKNDNMLLFLFVIKINNNKINPDIPIIPK